MPNSESNKNGWKDNQPECNHEHKHHEKKEECCCKESMKRALELLSDPTIHPYLNPSSFGFIGKHYLVGTSLLDNVTSTDNLATLTATFNGFSSCNCNTIKLASTSDIFYPTPIANTHTLTGFTGNHLSLCEIEAVSFQFTPTTTVTRLVFEANLTALLDKYDPKCHIKCDECCCNDGIFNDLYNSYSPNIVSLTAGWLAVVNAKVLGRIGNVLVLSNTAPSVNQIYFACLDSVGFMNY